MFRLIGILWMYEERVKLIILSRLKNQSTGLICFYPAHIPADLPFRFYEFQDANVFFHRRFLSYNLGPGGRFVDPDLEGYLARRRYLLNAGVHKLLSRDFYQFYKIARLRRHNPWLFFSESAVRCKWHRLVYQYSSPGQLFQNQRQYDSR